MGRACHLGRIGYSTGWPAVRLLFGALLFSPLLISALSACSSPAATPLPPLPTNTSTPPPPTPSATPVWFPPTATLTPFPTPLITPTLEVHPDYGVLMLADDFSDPAPWALSQSANTSVALGVNALTLALNQPGGYLYTLRNAPLLGNFYLEITARPSLCRGQDEYGLLLRVSPGLEFYRFSLSCDGQLRVDKYFQGTASSPQPWVLSGAIPRGAPSRTRLAVEARGREISFFANDEFLLTVSDPSLTSGALGLFIRSANDTAVTVSFSDLQIYALDVE